MRSVWLSAQEEKGNSVYAVKVKYTTYSKPSQESKGHLPPSPKEIQSWGTSRPFPTACLSFPPGLTGWPARRLRQTDYLNPHAGPHLACTDPEAETIPVGVLGLRSQMEAPFWKMVWSGN